MEKARLRRDLRPGTTWWFAEQGWRGNFSPWSLRVTRHHGSYFDADFYECRADHPNPNPSKAVLQIATILRRSSALRPATELDWLEATLGDGWDPEGFDEDAFYDGRAPFRPGLEAQAGQD